jgi:large repetitive protein
MALTSATGEMNHRLNAGDTLTATVSFSGVVNLDTRSGSPTLHLVVGAQTVEARYVSGTGTNALVFVITIVNGQTDLDGVAIASNALHLNGASLQDTLGRATLNTASAVLSNPLHLVDTTAPIAKLEAGSLTLTQTQSGTLQVQSNELGKAYVVPSTSIILNLSDLENLSPLVSKSVAIDIVQSNTPLSLSGLPAAVYHLYAVDLAGNVSVRSAESFEVTADPTTYHLHLHLHLHLHPPSSTSTSILHLHLLLLHYRILIQHHHRLPRHHHRLQIPRRPISRPSF